MLKRSICSHFRHHMANSSFIVKPHLPWPSSVRIFSVQEQSGFDKSKVLRLVLAFGATSLDFFYFSEICTLLKGEGTPSLSLY
jgi:hypothetical protein